MRVYVLPTPCFSYTVWSFYKLSLGNLVPRHDHFENETTVGGECGALELACSMNKAQVIVVFGHSDCKAMNLLYSLRNDMSTKAQGPLERWLKLHGQETVEQYKKLESIGDFTRKLKFRGAQQEVEFEAFIDPQNAFSLADKFSQVERFIFDYFSFITNHHVDFVNHRSILCNN